MKSISISRSKSTHISFDKKNFRTLLRFIYAPQHFS